MTCFAAKLLTFVVALDECSRGSCLSTFFVFDQQAIHRKTLRRISGVAQLQRIILKSKSATSEREIILKIEKIKDERNALMKNV